jgi:hypothetical protein
LSTPRQAICRELSGHAAGPRDPECTRVNVTDVDGMLEALGVHAFAGICFVVSALAELGGIALLVRQAGQARRQLEQWADANPKRHLEGSFQQQTLINPLVTGLLRERARPQTAIFLLVVGVLLGTVGNFLTL